MIAGCRSHEKMCNVMNIFVKNAILCCASNLKCHAVQGAAAFANKNSCVVTLPEILSPTAWHSSTTELFCKESNKIGSTLFSFMFKCGAII